MIKPDIPKEESKRLANLQEYSILDTLPEQEYDEITQLASYICGVPISLISLIDDKRQWFKSHHGTDATETPKEYAFCAHAINQPDNVMIIPDSRKDKRFKNNPLVIDDPHVIFYAGVPLVTPAGYSLGTLCVIDNKPNNLSDNQVRALKALSNQLMKLLELRKKSKALEAKVYELEIQNSGLEKFAYVAAHDIKSPLNSIVALNNLFKQDYSEIIDEKGLSLLEHVNLSSSKLTQLIDGILKYSKSTKKISDNKEEVNITTLSNELISLLDSKGEVLFKLYPEKDIYIFTNKTALEQILINLIGNSIKYNDKEKTEITLKIGEYPNFVKFNIIDNGPGVKKEEQDKIFQIFETSANKTRNGERGSGIGLATVKSLVEGLGGSITVQSDKRDGCNFEFTIKK
ncbi:GAF domain-containing sensor histidine kinase [Flammeovirgaceae bacterium SG7u.111]|nr:GAF domain-containing sensor histidine kinase [Flammeovirgaceae bacterium SG7u.132]WPO37624.1 GAF domain-containing sensor histidine kinase [Flammeovirgaceae bacterium SG7u.111]